jgi:hypothetical protein
MNEQELKTIAQRFFPSAINIAVTDLNKQLVSFTKHGDYYLISVDSDHEITYRKHVPFIITAEDFFEVSALPARYTRTMQSFRVTFHVGKLFAVIKMFSVTGDYHSYTVSKNCDITKGFDKLSDNKLGLTSTDTRHALRLLHSKPRKAKS